MMKFYYYLPCVVAISSCRLSFGIDSSGGGGDVTADLHHQEQHQHQPQKPSRRRLTGKEILAKKEELAPFEDTLMRAFGVVSKNKKTKTKAAIAAADNDEEEEHMHRNLKGWSKYHDDILNKGYYEQTRHDTKGSYGSYSSKSKSKSRSRKSMPSSSGGGGGDWAPVNYDDDLAQCNADLDQHDLLLKECKANAAAPSYLFVQMANECTIEKRDDGKFYLSSDQFAPDTWTFTDRPIQHEDTEATEDFFADFADVFGDNPPNAAVILVSEDSEQFEGPLVAVFLDAAIDQGGGTYSYQIHQSEDQESVMSIDSFLQPGESSTSYLDCSVFIDNANGNGKHRYELINKNHNNKVMSLSSNNCNNNGVNVVLDDKPSGQPRCKKVWRVNDTSGNGQKITSMQCSEGPNSNKHFVLDLENGSCDKNTRVQARPKEDNKDRQEWKWTVGDDQKIHSTRCSGMVIGIQDSNKLVLQNNDSSKKGQEWKWKKVQNNCKYES